MASDLFGKSHETGRPENSVMKSITPVEKTIAEGQDAQVPERPSFYRSLRIPFLLSLGVQFLVAPFTSVAPDVAVWLQTSQRTMTGISLYQLTGFSYPPLYGYWCMAIGGASRLLGLAPSSLGGAFHQLPGFWQFGGAYIVTNPWYTLVLKFPLIAGTALTGYFIWRIVLNLWGTGETNVRRARLAFLFWSLSPLVLFVTAVHGQIDPLVSCAVAGSVLFTLEHRWVLSGILVAIGVATKLSPVFLVPILVGLAMKPGTLRVRQVGGLIVGGLAGGLITFGPTFGSDFTRNVFTRTGQGGGLGGLGPFGLLILPLINRIWVFVNDHLSQIGQIGLLINAVVALICGWWVWKSDRSSTVITMSLLIMLVITLTSPALNAQYVLWYYPFLAIAASGVLGQGTRWYQVSAVIISLASPLFTTALFGPSNFFVPSTAAFRMPTVGSIQHQWRILYQPHNPSTFLPGVNKDRIGFLCAAATTFAFLILLAAIWMIERRATNSSPVTKPAAVQRDRRVAPIFLSVILVVAFFGVAAPKLWSPPTVQASVSPAAIVSAAKISISSNGESNIHFIGFAAERSHSPDHLFVYNSPRRPTAGATNSSVLGTLQFLQASFGSEMVSQIDARALRTAFENKQAARRTVIVDVSGTLPSSVWRPGATNLVKGWISAGGTLVWAGEIPGFLSARPGPLYATGPEQKFAPNLKTLSYLEFLLPANVIKRPDSWRRTDHRTGSPWYRALQLSYTNQGYPLSIAGIVANHGLILGQIDLWKTTNIAFVPRGKGGILVFAGYDTADQIGADVAKLLRGHILDASGLPSQTIANSPHSKLMVAVNKSTMLVELISLSDNPESIWQDHKEWSWPPQ
jgi:hypothetical protein